MTFDVDIGGARRLVTVEPAGAAGPNGGRFRVVTRPAPKDTPSDALAAPGAGDQLDLDVRPTDLGLHVMDPTSGRVVDAAVTDRGSGQWLIQLPAASLVVVVDGRLRAVRATSAGAAGLQRVTTPMPGRVARVLVAPGDQVEARQGLVVIEAMKMENELTALRAGRVREVTVTVGAAVEAGRLLVLIE
jgi:biotin carboxyl carrier protein